MSKKQRTLSKNKEVYKKKFVFFVFFVIVEISTFLPTKKFVFLHA